MKPLSILFTIAWTLAALGCADPLERRTGSEVQEQIGRGIRGKGQIGPIEREPGDLAGEHGVPQTHP